MPDIGLQTPVLFLIFNRPQNTQLVFDAIRLQKPKYLYVAADGPRAGVENEATLCATTREIALSIDWDCDVKTLLRNENLGCGKAVSGAINWFFENVEEGIILEDDCLPDESFFKFCEELLAKHRHNEKIMHIGGSNFQQKAVGKYSYYYSNYIHVWGWATWKRAWEGYEFDLAVVPNKSFQKTLKTVFPDHIERAIWEKIIDNVAHRRVDTWDIQWLYHIYKNNGVGITPNVNLVTNIGFGPLATHTFQSNDPAANVPTSSIEKIKHPAKIRIAKKADRFTYKKFHQGANTRFNVVKFNIGKKIPLIKALYLAIKKMLPY